MKKLYRPLCFVAAVAAMSLTSCQKENFNPAGEGETVTITVHANVEDVANTSKTHIEGTQVLWDENEEMKVIAFNNADPDNTGSESNSTEFTPSADFTTATFKATVDESKNPDRIAGVYPTGAAVGLGSVSGNEVNATSYKVELAADQSATATSYDPSTYIMIARADNYPLENNEWTAYYKRATALNQMILSGITDDIKSVTITFPEGQQAAGRRYFNLATGEAGEIYYGQTNAVTVNYATPLKAGNGENDVWFTSWNVNVKTGESITVKAESATKIYTKTLTATKKDVALMENYLNIFPFDMTGAEVEDVELTKVSIAEFLAAEVSDNVWYELTGTITDLYNTEYGNFHLVDETGTVRVYGLTAEKVSSNDKSFSSLGLKEGDIVTLIGTRTEYNNEAQVGGPAYYVSHVVAPYCEATPLALNVSSEAGTTTFNISSNEYWMIESNNPAYTVSPEEGTGNATITVTYPANESEEPVEVSFTVLSDSGIENTVTLTHRSAISEESALATLVTSESEIGPGKYIILGEFSEGVYALPNKESSSSAPVEVAIGSTQIVEGDGVLTAIDDNYVWQFTSSGNGFTINPSGNSSIGLGCTNANNGLRNSSSYADVVWTFATTSAKSGWEISSFDTQNNQRWICGYQPTNWRTYKDATTNANCTFRIYKLSE